MLKLEKFYDYLYFIGMKSLLIDNTTWTKIDEKYSIKMQLLTDGNSEVPEFSIMVVNSFGRDVYEHRIIISKLNDINGISAIFPIMKRCSICEKKDYIFQKDLTNNVKPYSMRYIPIHLKPVSNSLFNLVKQLYDNCINDLSDKIKEEKGRKSYSINIKI